MLEPTNYKIQEYVRADCVIFRRTKEEYGGLSNMAGGYPLTVSGLRFLSSEALYQACRFPTRPDIQRLILLERSPMAAKMLSRKYCEHTRPDWDASRAEIMQWCLRVKLVQHWDRFRALLLMTGTRVIVEESIRDDFWGAKPRKADRLFGRNVLGNLLMQLRSELLSDEVATQAVIAPSIPNFLLDGRPIERIISGTEQPPTQQLRLL